MSIFFSLALVFSLLATVRVALLSPPVRPRWVNFVSHPMWCLLAILNLPMCVGQFGRGELSAVPWSAFFPRFVDVSQFSGQLCQFLIVSSVDVWLFVGLAQAYTLMDQQRENRDLHVWYRIALNLLFGLLVVTPHNAIERLFS